MQRFKDILCVLGSDEENDITLERAVTLANNNQAKLTAVKVIEQILPDTKLLERFLSDEDITAKLVEEHLKKLERLVSSWMGKVEIQIKVLTGTEFLEIIREVLRNRRDLVIKVAESGGLMDRMFGSNDMHLLRECPCPVWLVKPDMDKTYNCILAAVDVDDIYTPDRLRTNHALNIQILQMASSLALSDFAELHIVYAWGAIGEGAMRYGMLSAPEDEINSYVEAVKQRNKQNLEVLTDEVFSKLGSDAMGYLKPQTHLLQGLPSNAIPEFAHKHKADLVIMGTVARTGIPGFFMGNTAETIINKLECSVLAIKPQGFATPITLEE